MSRRVCVGVMVPGSQFKKAVGAGHSLAARRGDGDVYQKAPRSSQE